MAWRFATPPDKCPNLATSQKLDPRFGHSIHQNFFSRLCQIFFILESTVLLAISKP
jgi:hypothetical protein